MPTNYHDVPDELARLLKPERGDKAFRRISDAICPSHKVDAWNPCAKFSTWVYMLAQNAQALDGGWKTALPGFTTARLKKLQKLVLKIIPELDALRETPFVRQYRNRQLLDPSVSALLPGGILTHSPLSPSSRVFFEDLFRLRFAARELIGDPRKPKRADWGEALEGMEACIHKYSGGKRLDESVADLLSDLGIDKASAESLRIRRSRKNSRSSAAR